MSVAPEQVAIVALRAAAVPLRSIGGRLGWVGDVSAAMLDGVAGVLEDPDDWPAPVGHSLHAAIAAIPGAKDREARRISDGLISAATLVIRLVRGDK